MPVPLSELAKTLGDEIDWIHQKWQDYRELFAQDQSRIDLLNQTAPGFFANLQRCLWGDLLHHLARITDPAEANPPAPYTLRQVPTSIRQAVVRSQANDLVEKAVGACAFARKWRDLKLKDKGFPSKADDVARLNAPARTSEVEGALQCLRGAMTLLVQHMRASHGSAQPPAGFRGGVHQLLHRLREGVAVRQDEGPREKTGKIPF